MTLSITFFDLYVCMSSYLLLKRKKALRVGTLDVGCKDHHTRTTSRLCVISGLIQHLHSWNYIKPVGGPWKNAQLY